jgi:hypothetical protein
MSKLPQSARFGDRANPVKTAPELYDVYDYAEFTIATGITDYDVRANQSKLFKNCGTALLAVFEYNKNISVKFNSTALEAINFDYGLSPKEWSILKITDIYITNASGANVTIGITLV